jgi:ribose-phosphate pyrophosphokinase
LSTTVVVHEDTNASLAERIAKNLGVAPIKVSLPIFPNGEAEIHGRPIEADRAVVVFPKIHDINRQLIEFMLMCGLCRGCDVIDAVIPYIPYSRQNDTAAHAMVLKILDACQLRLIITVDIHNPVAFSNHNIINMLPHEVFADVVEKHPDLLIVAPDHGAIHRAQKFADAIGSNVVFIDKHSGAISNCAAVVGTECVIVDDIIDSGRTISIASDLLRNNGCTSVSACISHGFFSSGVLRLPHLDALYISESFDYPKLIDPTNLSTVGLDRPISAALATHTKRS